MSGRDKVTKALLDWFGKSQVVDRAGKPLVVFRGEHGELPPGETFQSRLPSLSFGDKKAANLYATDPNNWRDVVQAPRVAPGYLKIENPIFKNTSDPFVDLSQLESKLGTEEAARIAHKFDNDIRYTGNWDENYSGRFDSVPHLLKQEPAELKNLYFDAFKYLDNPEEIARLKTRGFDGAIHIGNGETATDLEYRIFDPSQFRSKYKLYGGAAAPAGAMGALADQQDPYQQQAVLP